MQFIEESPNIQLAKISAYIVRSAHYTVLQMKNSASTTIQKIRRFVKLSITNLAIALHFQLCSARHTVLQTKNSVRIVSAIIDNRCLCCNQFSHHGKYGQSPFTNVLVGKPCIALPRINTLGCQQKEMGHKGGHR